MKNKVANNKGICHQPLASTCTHEHTKNIPNMQILKAEMCLF